MIKRSNTRKIIIGAIAALAAFALCFSLSGSLFKSMVLSVGFLILGCIRIDIPKPMQFPVIIFVLMFSAGLALFLSQFVQNEGLASLKAGLPLLGYLCCLILSLVIFLLSLSLRYCLIGTVGITLLLSTLNLYIYRFRGSEFLPIDILSVGTAMNVANQYDFTITPNLLYSWVIFFLFAMAVCSVHISKPSRKSRGYLGILTVAVLSCISFALCTRNISAIHFGNGGTYYHGYILNYVLSAKELFVPKPDGYSQESVNAILEPYLSESGDYSAKNMPNIIVIMDEAYSDLQVLGNNFRTSSEVSPFIQSLEENTVKGYAMSSAYGGRTANSEFEFLTGATLGFVPKGTVAYQQYIKEETISLASLLKHRGYATVAMHPFLKNGWTRNTVWPNLGFEECHFLDDFPQEKLMRGFVSDQEMMEYIIQRFEKQDIHVPLFLFGVTMQNHSSYDYTGDDFSNTSFLCGYSREYPSADQYLTLIHESDKAAEFLIQYLSKSERDTVVVWFGDHLPALDTALYEEIHGGTFQTLDEQSCHYKVPFFIWANYDIPEKQVACTSLSFLSSLVFQFAGMELTPYQRFLLDVESVIPAINMEGYYSKSYKQYSMVNDATGTEYDWLNRYQKVQYCYLFDEPNPIFYGIGS